MNPMHVWVALSLILGGCLHGRQREYPHAQAQLQPARLSDVPLKTTDGKSWKLSDWRSRWVILLLGFTQCPDICPMGLTYLAKETQELPVGERLRVLFVSVDPKRDRPRELAAYVRHFDRRFLAATGEPHSLVTFAQSLGAAFMLEKPDAKGRYNVQHSTSLYLIDPEGRLVAAYDSNGKPGGLRSDLTGLLR